MRITITGSTGFIGQSLLRYFENQGLGDYHVAPLKRGSNVSLHMVENEPDVIINCAGEIYDEESMVEANVEYLKKILDNARSLGNKCKIIHLGSSSEYGRKLHPTREYDDLEPVTFYEVTKACGTMLCQAYVRKYGMDICIIRPYSVYGKLEPTHRLIPTVINNIKSGRLVKVSPGKHDFIHIDDFIKGVVTLIEKGKSGSIYNCGGGKQYSNREVVDIIGKIIGKEYKVEEIEKLREFDSDYWVSDSRKLQNLGWTPYHTLETGLAEVINGHPLP